MIPKTLILFSVFLIVSFTVFYLLSDRPVASISGNASSSFECGLNCLKRIGALTNNRFNVSSEFLQKNSGQGVSMLDLKLELERNGYSVLARKNTLSNLLAISSLALIHVNGDHFILVEALHGAPRIIDDPMPPVKLSPSSLDPTKRYSALLIQQDFKRESFPRICLDRKSYETDSAGGSNFRKVDIVVRNDGYTPLIIKKITKSCGCLRINENSFILEKGEIFLLNVQLKSDGTDLSSTENIILETNDPQFPVLNISIFNKGGSRFHVPVEEINFGYLSVFETSERSIRIWSKPGEDLLPVELAFSKGVLDVVLDRKNHRINFSIDGSSLEGKLQQEVEVFFQNPDGEGRELIKKIKVTAQPGPKIEIFPATVILSAREQGRESSFRISPSKGHRLNPILLELNGKKIEFKNTVDQNGDFLITTVFDSRNLAKGLMEAKMLFENGPNKLEVPIRLFLVE